MTRFLSLLGFFVILLPAPAFSLDRAAVENRFQIWLQDDFWPEAAERGISRQTFDRAFKNFTLNWKLPDLVAPGTGRPINPVQRQSEFRSPGRYFNQNHMGSLVATGRQLAVRHKSLITRIEEKYGVPGAILLAIWGRESAFGQAWINNNIFQVLGTKAYLSTRKDLFRKELLAALTILERNHATVDQMQSSWAGAMGQPQFLPSSYLDYAVDFDGDGKRNIWTSVPDILASIANYLNRFGWQKGRDWGFEAAIPDTLSCRLEGPDQMRQISEWVRAGITRISGRPFPESEKEQEGALLFPAGRSGPVFVATPNFYTIKKYNNSDLYALFVGNLADRIQYSNKPFVVDWKEVSGLAREDVRHMQRALIRLGYDVGGADGLAGFKTRRSIGDWQEKNGLAATCFPSASLVSQF